MPTVISASYIDYRYRTGVTKAPAIYSYTSGNKKYLGYQLLPLKAGTITRTTSGSLHNGSTASLAWADPNVLRYEDRNDGNGAIALFEGSRTNQILQSQNLGASWAFDSAVVGSDAFLSPEGELNAYWISASASPARTRQTFDLTKWDADTTGSLSAFVKVPATSLALGLNIRARDAVDTTGIISASSEWRRFDYSLSNRSGSVSTLPGMRTTDANEIWAQWGYQVEVGAQFPSSYIKTTTPAATRGADTLTFASGTYPVNLIGSGSLEVDVYPDFSSDDVINGGGGYTIFGINTNNLLRFEKSTTTCRLRLIDAAKTRLFANVTFSRQQKMTIRLLANAENTAWISASLSGFTTGDGDYALVSPVDWTDVYAANPLYIGNVAGMNNAFYGRISDIRRVT